MPLKQHVENTFKLSPDPAPYHKMALSFLSSTLPMIVGYFRGELPVAIFGALFGFTLILLDHFGPLKKRIAHLIVSTIFLILGFLLGAWINGDVLQTSIALFIISFVLGKTKNNGIELERVLLFTAIQLLVASGTPGILPYFPKITFYCLIAFASHLCFLYIFKLKVKQVEEAYTSKKATMIKVIKEKTSVKFALVFAFTATIGYDLAILLKISHGYWVVVTTLIVMLPDSYQSFYKSAQRVMGTFIGVLLGAFILSFGFNPIWVIVLVSVCTYFIPYGMTRNYWVANIFIAALVVFLLELTKSQHTGSLDIALLRATDIGLGCLLGLIGTLINNPKIIFPLKAEEKIN
jgi:hypothetical protein